MRRLNLCLRVLVIGAATVLAAGCAPRPAAPTPIGPPAPLIAIAPQATITPSPTASATLTRTATLHPGFITATDRRLGTNVAATITAAVLTERAAGTASATAATASAAVPIAASATARFAQTAAAATLTAPATLTAGAPLTAVVQATGTAAAATRTAFYFTRTPTATATPVPRRGKAAWPRWKCPGDDGVYMVNPKMFGPAFDPDKQKNIQLDCGMMTGRRLIRFTTASPAEILLVYNPVVSLPLGMCLEDRDGLAALRPCSGADEQAFRLEPWGDRLQLRALGTDRCLFANHGLFMGTCAAGPQAGMAQPDSVFRLRPAAGHYQLNFADGCLSVLADSFSGGRLTFQPCSAADPNQMFHLGWSDALAPVGELIAPADGPLPALAPIALAANVWDPGDASGATLDSGVARADFFASYDGAAHLIGSDSFPPYGLTWSPPAGLSPQALIFSVQAEDRAGNRSGDLGAPRRLDFAAAPAAPGAPVDSEYPDGRLTAPAAGSPLTAPILLAADAWDGGSGVAEVGFWAAYDGLWHALGAAAQPPYQLTWTPPTDLASQTVQLAISVTDGAGNRSEQAGGALALPWIAPAPQAEAQNWLPAERRAYLNQRALPEGEAICSAASMAMTLAMNGLIPSDPSTLANKAVEMFPRVLKDDWAYVSLMVEELRRQGAASEYRYLADSGAGFAAMRAEIDAGRAVILSTHIGQVTTSGHFIVAVGYRAGADGSGGQVIAYDPYGRWLGSLNAYDRNSTDPASQKGRWVLYDWARTVGPWQITAVGPSFDGLLPAPGGLPLAPDLLAVEPPEAATYLGWPVGLP